MFDLSVSLQTKCAGFFHSNEQFLIQHGVRRVGRQVEAVKAGVSSEK